jgi:hypothetical protein
VSCLFLFGQRLLPHYAVARHISLAACLLDPTPPEHEFPTAPLASGLRGAGGGAVENSAPVPRLPTATFSAIFVRISTAIYTANLSGTSIGAGLQAIVKKGTFRDLSTSIDSHDDRGHHRRASGSVQESAQECRHRTP